MLISHRANLIFSPFMEMQDFKIALPIKRETAVVIVDVDGVINKSNRSAITFPVHANDGLPEVEWPEEEK